jgi:uncharacterized protein YcfJ
MNKSMLIGTVFGAAVATAAAGFAGYSMLNKNGVDSGVARQNCYEVAVETPREAKDDKRIAGTLIGALVGGAVGKDVGDSGVTTAAGAAVGAIAGNQAQKKLQENRTVTATETRCDPGK